MQKFTICLILLLMLVVVSGCGTIPEKASTQPRDTKQWQTGSHSQPETQLVIKKKLYTQYQKWRGVRYKLGGLSRDGIDCSGFVHVTFKNKLGIDLPRTTSQQSQLGRKIARTELKAGDLVFFKTGPALRHVGIYLEQGKFLHASRKKGVIISHMDNIYWKSNYWKAIRV